METKKIIEKVVRKELETERNKYRVEMNYVCRVEEGKSLYQCPECKTIKAEYSELPGLKCNCGLKYEIERLKELLFFIDNKESDTYLNFSGKLARLEGGL